MSKLNQWLTLVANLCVLLGIGFLALELRQNTDMMRAEIRDSITAKQMEYYGWVATTPETADVFARAVADGVAALEPGAERAMFSFLVQGMFREFENSYYQYQQGLFTAEEFEPRKAVWRIFMAGQGPRDHWQARRETYSPSFRAEIDQLIASAEN